MALPLLASPRSDSERTEPGSAPRDVPVTPAPSKPLHGRSRSGAVSSLMHPKNLPIAASHRFHERQELRRAAKSTVSSRETQLGAYTAIWKCGFWDEPVSGRAGSASPRASQQQLQQEPGAKWFCSLLLSRLHRQLVRTGAFGSEGAWASSLAELG